MCCFLAAIGLVGPRIALVFAWLFTDRVQVAFHGGWLAPLVGLIVLPWTTLTFVLAYAPIGGVNTLGWCFVALGFIFDIGSYTSGGRSRQVQRA